MTRRERGGGVASLEQVLESRKSVASANLEINRGKSVERDGSNEKWSKLISFGSRPKDETPEVSRHGSRSFSLLDYWGELLGPFIDPARET